MSKIFTDSSGSSLWFSGSFVTYGNDLKEIIGVNKSTLELYGAVSREVALEMSEAALKLANSDVCLSITGIAGPKGGIEKPIGIVHFSYIDKYGQNFIKNISFLAQENKESAAEKGIQIILDCVREIKTQ